MMCTFRHISYQKFCPLSQTIYFMKLIYLLLFLPLLRPELLHVNTIISNSSDNCQQSTLNNVTEIAIGNCEQLVYYIQLGVGTPPQLFKFQLDTTTQLMWFPMKNGFKFSQSSTFKIQPNMTNASYHHEKSYQGYAGSDFITLQETNISARSPILWVDQEMEILFQPEISGIVGMGFSEFPNFFDTAYLEGEIKSPIFALHLHNSSDNSVIYYNEIPEAIAYNTHYVPIIGKGLWKIQLKGFMVAETDFSYYAEKSLIFDSRLDWINLNENLFQSVKQQFFRNCSYIEKMSSIQCKCRNNFPTIKFILDELEVFLHPHNYAEKIGNHNCLIKIRKSDEITLGNAFFKEYILTFDKLNKRLGLMGDLLPVHIIGSQYFELAQYIVMSLFIFEVGFGLYLIYYLRKEKEVKEKGKSGTGKGDYFELP